MAGNLDEIRDASRAAVHAQFALPAVIANSEGSPIGAAAVRLHNTDSRAFGDLDREGFATVTEDVDYIIIDTRVFVGASERDRVHFPNLNRTFRLDVEHPSEDGIFVKWEVVEDSQP